MTNFLLVPFADADRAARVAAPAPTASFRGPSRRPSAREQPADHGPRSAENDRLLAAARAWGRPGAIPDERHRPRRPARPTSRRRAAATVTRTTRETSSRSVRSRRQRQRGHRHRHRLLGSLAGFARPPRPVRHRDQGDRRPGRRRAPHRRGRCPRPGQRLRGGARRPGRDRPIRRRPRADGRVARERRVDIGGRPYAVVDLPFRGERVGQLPLQLVEHALEAFARTAGATIHVSGTGRNDHHLAEAAFKALGRALREACELDPRRTESPRSRARSDDPAAGPRRDSSTTAPATS